MQSNSPESMTNKKSPSSPWLMTHSSASTDTSFWASFLAITGGTNTFLAFHSPKASAETLRRNFLDISMFFLNCSGSSSTSSKSSSLSLASRAALRAAIIAHSCIVDLRALIWASNCSFSRSNRSCSAPEMSFSSIKTLLLSIHLSMKVTGSAAMASMASDTHSSRIGFNCSTIYLFFASDTAPAIAWAAAPARTREGKGGGVAGRGC
mmetsp:Transcript_34614/g.98229  ORF Transcript_34614/g.98229 Transcript_34614/m.98229 type:complete len:208 (-) Transcript_34614:9-632(-)